jgi:hypothetical protein
MIDRFIQKIKTKDMNPKDNQAQVDRPDDIPVVNEEEQNKPVNPGDENNEAEDKANGYKEGIHNDSNTDGLPGEDDDSVKTIRETPKMSGV